MNKLSLWLDCSAAWLCIDAPSKDFLASCFSSYIFLWRPLNTPAPKQVGQRVQQAADQRVQEVQPAAGHAVQGVQRAVHVEQGTRAVQPPAGQRAEAVQLAVGQVSQGVHPPTGQEVQHRAESRTSSTGRTCGKIYRFFLFLFLFYM